MLPPLESLEVHRMKSVRRVQLYTCSLLHVQRHVDLSRLLRNLQNIKAQSLSKYTDNILVQKLELVAASNSLLTG